MDSKKKEKIDELKDKQYQPSRFIKMRQQALLQQSLNQFNNNNFLGEMPSFSGSQNQAQRSQSSEIEKKKFKPTFSEGNLAQSQKSINLTSFEKKQLFPAPAAKTLKEKPERKKTPQLPPFKQASSDGFNYFFLNIFKVQITLGGYTSTDRMPSIVQSKEVQEQQQIQLDEKQYLRPINFDSMILKTVSEGNNLAKSKEEENLKEQFPPLAAKLEAFSGEEKIQLTEALTLIQFPQKLPIKEQLDYFEKNQKKLAIKKIPDFLQSQENKQYLLKFLVKHSEQSSPLFTKLIPNNYYKKCFTEKEKGAFRLGKVYEYESGKVEMNIGGVNFMVLQGAKQDFVSEACVIQQPCNSESSSYELVQLGEIDNKLVVVPKFN